MDFIDCYNLYLLCFHRVGAVCKWSAPLKLTTMEKHFLITVLVIYGIHATTQPQMIFSGLYNKLFYLLSRWMKDPSKILKVLFDCTPCMASLYGSVSFFFFFPEPSFHSWAVWVFSLCGFNWLLNKFINRWKSY